MIFIINSEALREFQLIINWSNGQRPVQHAIMLPEGEEQSPEPVPESHRMIFRMNSEALREFQRIMNWSNGQRPVQHAIMLTEGEEQSPEPVPESHQMIFIMNSEALREFQRIMNWSNGQRPVQHAIMLPEASNRDTAQFFDSSSEQFERQNFNTAASQHRIEYNLNTSINIGFSLDVLIRWIDPEFLCVHPLIWIVVMLILIRLCSPSIRFNFNF